MILYVNGEDFSAGAKAVNDYSFANDDFRHVALGTKPHPENLVASYGMHLSKMLALALVCNAEAQFTNQQILETTNNYLENIDPKQYTIVIIGWTKVAKNRIEEHGQIYNLHRYLVQRNITHLYFNATDPFSNVPKELHKDWGFNFIEPYSSTATGHTQLSWAQYLFNHLTKHKISI